MGIGAAFVMPTTLSIITNVFPPEERGKAVGVWASVAGGGAVIGLLLSGTLLEWFSRPSVFATSVVFAIVAAAATVGIVPSSRSSSVVRLDPIGAVLSSLGLTALVFSIIEPPHRGWGERCRSAASRQGSCSSSRSFSSSCAVTTRCSTRGSSRGAASASARSR